MSVIVPALADARFVSRLVGWLPRAATTEVIVVDGGVDPGLDAVAAARADVRLVRAPAGRACQMNAGARLARGRWLLFLHADSRPPDGWLDALADAEASGAAGGWFRLRIDAERWQARLIERLAGLRVALFGLAYGNQGLFVRRDVFERMGGYRELPLMEDVEFVRRLAREGRMHPSPLSMTTSARRWERDGWLRRSGGNLVLLSLYLLGASPAWLARHYERRGRQAIGRTS